MGRSSCADAIVLFVFLGLALGRPAIFRVAGFLFRIFIILTITIRSR